MAYTIYSKPGCGSCDEAKNLLSSLGLSYHEVIIDVGQQKDPSKRYSSVGELLALVPNARSVPQIFKNGQHLGGLDALKKSVASS